MAVHLKPSIPFADSEALFSAEDLGDLIIHAEKLMSSSASKTLNPSEMTGTGQTLKALRALAHLKP